MTHRVRPGSRRGCVRFFEYHVHLLCAGKNGRVVVATHGGPESCAATRKGGGEALTGAGAGRVSSREEAGGRPHLEPRHLPRAATRGGGWRSSESE